ncbi:MAG: type II CAAX endopeptidase family protein [Bryobacteraceae bacterium]
MHTLILGLLLLSVLGFLVPGVQRRSRSLLQSRPVLLFAAPAGLGLIFCVLAASVDAFSVPLALLVFAYLFAPAVVAFRLGATILKRPSWLDFAIILMLWLPLEFAAGQHLVPKPAQGFLHSVAYGIGILIALVIFVSFRAMPGMRYNLARPVDLGYGVVGFLITAPVLIVVGLWLGFIPPFHMPAHPSATRMASTFLVIFVGTALPEEILFRSLIQNWFTQRYGFSIATLLIAGFIFGAAHLDNGPQPQPNWRYMILATIAGVAYGKVFQKSSSVFSSVTFHALVDATKHVFF